MRSPRRHPLPDAHDGYLPTLVRRGAAPLQRAACRGGLDMTYDRDADRLALLEATLSHAAFDGWSQKALEAGGKDAGIPADRALNAFPGRLSELLAFYHEAEDREMLEAMQRANVAEMRVRDRIAFAVKARLERN